MIFVQNKYSNNNDTMYIYNALINCPYINFEAEQILEEISKDKTNILNQLNNDKINTYIDSCRLLLKYNIHIKYYANLNLFKINNSYDVFYLFNSSTDVDIFYNNIYIKYHLTELTKWTDSIRNINLKDSSKDNFLLKYELLNIDESLYVYEKNLKKTKNSWLNPFMVVEAELVDCILGLNIISHIKQICEIYKIQFK